MNSIASNPAPVTSPHSKTTSPVRSVPKSSRLAPPGTIRKVVIGPATLYHGDCLTLLPHLPRVDAVVTDPPYGIDFTYRTYRDTPAEYENLMRRLVPQLNRITAGGPCFVWQSPLHAADWHRYFPRGYRIIAACMQYPARHGKDNCLSWDPVIFWTGRGLLRDQLPRDWHVCDLRAPSGYKGDNPVPCPRPLGSVQYICESVKATSIIDPFMGSGTTGVAALLAGKSFVGIEQDGVYFDYACRRIARLWRAMQAQKTKASRPFPAVTA